MKRKYSIIVLEVPCVVCKTSLNLRLDSSTFVAGSTASESKLCWQCAKGEMQVTLTDGGNYAVLGRDLSKAEKFRYLNRYSFRVIAKETKFKEAQ